MYTLTTLVYLDTCLILVLVRRDVRSGLPITTVAVVATSLDVVRRRYPLSRTLTPSGINLYSCPLIIALEVVPAANAGVGVKICLARFHYPRYPLSTRSSQITPSRPLLSSNSKSAAQEFGALDGMVCTAVPCRGPSRVDVAGNDAFLSH